MSGPSRAQLRLADRYVNPFVRLVLRSPLHRLVSGNLLLLTYTRRNGTERTIPVQYTQQDDVVLVVPGWPERKRWWRALRAPAPVRVRLRGSTRSGVGVALVDGEGEAGAALTVTVRITLSGAPVPADRSR